MGIRFYCPNGHKLNVKEFQAGRKGICPFCGAKLQIPSESTRKASRRRKKRKTQPQGSMPVVAPTQPVGGVASAGPQTPVAAGPPASQTAPSAAVPPAQPFPGSAPGQIASAGTQAAAPAAGAPLQSSPVVVPQGPPAAAPSVSYPAAPGPGAATAPAAQVSSGIADPLTEAGDVVWYVRPASGGQFGPASGDVMRTWIGEGRVSVDSLVWREGWRDWREAFEVFPQLGAALPRSPLGEVTTAESPTTSATARGGRARPRRHSGTTQAILITVLVLAVIILSVVFALVASGTLGGQARTTTGRASTRLAQYDSARPLLPPAVRPPSE